MELKRYYSEEELSSIRFSCADEVVGEVKNLFFNDQLSEEQILLEIYSPNNGETTQVDQNRLKIDRIFSGKQIAKKCFMGRYKLVDSVKYQSDYPVKTILAIKNEQRRLGVEFKGFYALLPRNKFMNKKEEPLLFAALGENIFYLLNDYLLEEQKAQTFKPKNFFNWIRKKISFATSSRS